MTPTAFVAAAFVLTWAVILGISTTRGDDASRAGRAVRHSRPVLVTLIPGTSDCSSAARHHSRRLWLSAAWRPRPECVYFLTPHELLAKARVPSTSPFASAGRSSRLGHVNDATLDLPSRSPTGRDIAVPRMHCRRCSRRHRRRRGSLSARRYLQLDQPDGEALERVSAAQARRFT